MSAIRVLAIALIVAGALSLVFGGFDYAGDRQEAKLGPIEFSVIEQKRFSIPIWAGVAALGFGVALLFVKK